MKGGAKHMERVLITGGTGFIGGELLRGLLAEGRRTFVLARPAAAQCLVPHPGLTVLEGDLRDATSAEACVRAARPDVVFHLAAAGASAARGVAAEVFETNVQGTANLLRAAERHGCRAFVHAGSGAEYGPRDEAAREGDPLRPRGPYAVAKAAASLLSLQADLPAVVVRIFGAYGPGEGDERLLPYVAGCYRRGEAPRLSDGSQRRDFIHVEDVARLLRAAADVPTARGRVLHAATGRAWSVREAVELIARAVAPAGPPPAFGARPGRPDEPALYLGSRDETTALTGWRPAFDMPGGIENTLSRLGGPGRRRALAG